MIQKQKTYLLTIAIMLLLPFSIKAQTIKTNNMNNKIVIGNIYVPKAAIEEFKKQFNLSNDFLKNQPGYLGLLAFEHTDDSGNLNVVTVATWQNEELATRARQSMQAEYKRINFNQTEYYERLQIKASREIYNVLQH